MSKTDIKPAEIVEEHSDYLLSFAMMKLGDLNLAKDLVQDTLISAITKLDTFEKRSKLRTWLTSILNRKIIDHWRKAETKYTDPVSQFFNSDDNDHWITENFGGIEMETVETQIMREERHAELHDCINTLPEKWKGVMVSKYFDEKSSDEICKELEITPSNLWVIVHRAKILLRKCLQTKM